MTPVTDLLNRFERPDPSFGPVPIWWWSGAPLEGARLRWQMEQLTAQGVHQAVIMCLAPRGPIFGSVADDPPFLSEPWWDVFLAACADASALGFRFYLYDQLGFSGANFQGQLVSARPEFAGHELRRAQVTVEAGVRARLVAPPGAVAVGAYFVTADSGAHSDELSGAHLGARSGARSVELSGELDVPLSVPLEGGSASWQGSAGRLVLVYEVRHGFDYFCAAAGEALVDTVLGEFERRASRWFGEVIAGLFQDELPSMPTWGGDFLETFGSSRGYDLSSRIGALWEPGGTEAERTRRDYHAHRGHLAQRGFFGPLAAWTTRMGLVSGFDQQSPAREGDPVGGVVLYGDYLQTHGRFTAPGSDHWGDSKVHSSLAHARGHGRTWLEAFHSSGWGGTLEETYDWLAPFVRRGATLYDPHAVYYATVSGWWEWAAPSTCWRQPYWPTYGVFAGAVTRLCSLLTVGELVADTILLHPVVTSQALSTLDGALPDAKRCSEVYHELNGVTAWFSEAPGVLDRAAMDYEVFDDATVASGRVHDGRLHVAGGRFVNVVLPAAAVIDSALADRLVDLATSGGRVVCVGCAPRQIGEPDARASERFQQAVETGRIVVASTAADVPDLLRRGDVTVHADAPVLVRRHGDALVLVLDSHDGTTGTQAPIIPGHRNLNWVEDSFRWDRYWSTLAEKGYEFVPVGARRARVRVDVDGPVRAQQWDPRSGDRTQIDVRRTDAGVELDVPFEDGSVSVVVLAPELPPPTRRAAGPVLSETPIDGPWRIRARSTLDNRWADLGDPGDRGVLPLQVWRFDHAVEPEEGTEDGAKDGAEDGTDAVARSRGEVVATFGPYVNAVGPIDGDVAGRLPADDPRWQPAPFSLSRGIHKDELHFEYLGPKGMVPEEFLAWPSAGPGDWVAFRTRLEVPAGAGRHLVVGANAVRRIFVDGTEVPTSSGTGYWTATGLRDGAGVVDVEVWLLGDDALSPDPKDGPTSGIRASFAVVTDLAGYLRPEWLVPADGSVPGSVVTVSRQFQLEELPADARVQVATEGACVVTVNGREVGRQGAFEPYAEMRQMRVHPYDIGEHLAAGDNRIALHITDPGRPVAALVDSVARGEGGLGLHTGTGWSMTRDGVDVDVELRREQWTDPRWVCLFARPHPLPRAAWLDTAAAGHGVVLDLVPNALESRRRVEWLRFRAPAGAISIGVDANVPFVPFLDGKELAVDASGTIRLSEPLSPCDTVELRFETDTGHSAGGLLRGPVTVELDEVDAPLVDWEELGLRSLGGQVTYGCTFTVDALPADRTVMLDLGAVRGTAEVRVNDADPRVCVWSPYVVDVTSDVVPGENRLTVVVRGTLAGYLDDASPTPAVAAGQKKCGLYGPVVVQVREGSD